MRSFLNRYFLFIFLMEFGLIFPFYAVMFDDYGMSAGQIGLLLTTWSLVTFVFEIPSGAWADRFSRKYLLIIGQTIRAGGYLIWLLWPSFWGFLIGFILWGLESALCSGTAEALLYDGLKKYGKSNAFTKVYGRSEAISLIAILLSALAGSLLIEWGYALILWLSIGIALLSGLILLPLVEPDHRQNGETISYWRILLESFQVIRHTPRLLKLIIFISIASALPGALEEYWTLFADQVGIPGYGLGLLIALLAGFEALCSFLAYRIPAELTKLFFLFLILCGGLLTWAGVVYSPWTIVLLVLFNGLFQLVNVLFESELQHELPSHLRATLTSFSGFGIEVIALMTYLSFGTAAEYHGYQTAFIGSGWVIMAMGALLALYLFVNRSKS